MDREAAHDRLRAMIDADSDPALNVGETDLLLAECQIPDPAGNSPQNVSTAATWAAATGYLPGQVIKAGTRWWRCIIGGTSAATTPTWPDLDGSTVDITRTLTDGTVVWADNGAAWSPSWNLELAAMIGWERKAAKAAARYSLTTDGQSFQRAQIASACLTMADRHRRRLSMSSGTGPA